MYDEAAWPQLREALEGAQRSDGSGLLSLADSYYERGPNGKYANLMFANAAVNCLDLPPAFDGPDAVEKAVGLREGLPGLRARLRLGLPELRVLADEGHRHPHRTEAKGAAPIVVVGTTRDPATPYKWSEALAEQLSSGTLLTYEGDGHTAYGRGSDCIDTAINAYLLEGTPPTDGKKCT